MAHAGGRSQAEERLCEAVAILKISRRRKALYGDFFGNLTNVRTRRRASWGAALGHGVH
jgi:hypothetical protein